MARAVHPLDSARRDLLLHPDAAARIAVVLDSQGFGSDLEGAHPGKLRHLVAMESVSGRAFRSDGWPGGGLVHRAILRSALSSDGAQGATGDFLRLRRGGASAGRAV